MNGIIRELKLLYEQQGFEKAFEYYKSIETNKLQYDKKLKSEVQLILGKLCIVENKLDIFDSLFSITSISTQEKEEYEKLKEINLELQRKLDEALDNYKKIVNQNDFLKQENESLNKIKQEIVLCKRKEGIFSDNDFIQKDGVKILKDLISWDEFYSCINLDTTISTNIQENSVKRKSMTVDEAKQYCTIISKKLNKKVRLPTLKELRSNASNLTFDSNNAIYEWCDDVPHGFGSQWHTIVNGNLLDKEAQRQGKIYNSAEYVLQMKFRIVIEN